MTKKKTQPTKYKVVTGCANDKLKERYTAGDVVTLEGWSKKQIEWLLEKGAIKVVESDDDERPGDAARD
jgi:hypothetical protein